jgi:cycloartenol synthase
VFSLTLSEHTGGLVAFHEAFPEHRTREIKASIQRGNQFIKQIQRADGSWYGSWACCFTYVRFPNFESRSSDLLSAFSSHLPCLARRSGRQLTARLYNMHVWNHRYAAWFGIEGLVLTGEKKDSPSIRACVEFLKKHQNANGGWGEDFRSCFDKAYAAKGMEKYGDAQGSGVVTTAWALMAIALVASKDDKDCVDRAARYLMKRQQADGDWPQEGISGVFNRSCGITYTSYRNVFPIWALGRYATECKHLR